jgi:hypothetical protein
VNLRKLRTALVTALLFVVTLHLLLWTITPFIPYLITGLVLVGIYGFIYYRKTRW